MEIEEHLTFEDECITAKNGSKLGFDTIKKYRLNSELLDSLRGKQLIMFYKVLDIVRQNQVKEQRDFFSINEQEVLYRFAQSDYSFSLMFRLLLKKHNL
jgi:hypothetical protein